MSQEERDPVAPHRDSLPPSTWQRLCPHPGLLDDPVLRRIETLLDEREPRASLQRCEQLESYPDAVLRRLFDAGLSELMTEDEGVASRDSGVTMAHFCALNAITARRNGTLAITIGVTGLGLLPVWIAASPELRQRVFARIREGELAGLLLTELEHGSNLLRNQARAVAGGLDEAGAFVAGKEPTTHYRLVGEKHLINGATRHGMLVSFLRTRERIAEPEGPFAARSDFSLFAIERADTMVPLPRWRTLPMTGADISGLDFAGTVVPADVVIGQPGDGFGIVQRTLSVSRGAIGSLASGVATRATELALTYARHREIYGSPIVELGAIADHLCHALALDRTVAALALRAAAAVTAHELGGAHDTAVTKLAACVMAEEAITEGRRLMGARALLVGSPFERTVRDVLLYGVFDGTTHVMLEEISSRLKRTAGEEPGPPGEALEATGGTWRASPRSLVGGCRRRAAPRVIHPVARARALAGVEGVGPGVDALPAVAASLCALVRELDTRDRWDADQGLRFDAAEQWARLEGLLSAIELGDAACRTALGVPDAALKTTLDDTVQPYMVGWLGGRIASSLRELALREVLPIPEGLDEAAARLHQAGQAARAPLATALRVD